MSSQPGPSQGGTNNGTLVTLDNLFSDITTSNNPIALNHTLRNCAPKDIRDTILASTLSNGQDPLSVLDVRSNTIGILYILWVILNSYLGRVEPDIWRLQDLHACTLRRRPHLLCLLSKHFAKTLTLNWRDMHPIVVSSRHSSPCALYSRQISVSSVAKGIMRLAEAMHNVGRSMHPNCTIR